VSKDFIIFDFLVTKAIALPAGKAITFPVGKAFLIKIYYDFHLFFFDALGS
jgi:hypothetical protein